MKLIYDNTQNPDLNNFYKSKVLKRRTVNMKILVTPRSFAIHNPKPYQKLIQEGYEVIRNPYDRPMTQEEMEKNITEVVGVIIGVDPLNRAVLQKATNLKAIAKYGVGIDNIDIDFAKEKGIKVSRTVGANFEAVADYTIGLMLAVARKINTIDRESRKGNWRKIMAMEVYGKNLGIIGTGQIGKRVAKRAKGFDMSILAFDLNPNRQFAEQYKVQYVDLDTIYKEADIITLHVPLSNKTRHMISKREFSMMKNNAIVLNTARGGLIDEEALYDALKNNRIYGAGIDVFEQEPPANRKLFELDNIIISSHCAASTYEAVDKMGAMAVENLIRDLL